MFLFDRRLLLTCLLLSSTTLPAFGDEPPAQSSPRFGIEKRVPWTTSTLVGTPDPPSKYVTERVFPDLDFERPVEMQAIPGTDRLVVIEVKGRLFSFRDDPAAKEAGRAPFADLSKLDERFHRAYGIAFHPRFKENRYCYVSYVLEPDTPDGSRVSRFEVTDTDPPRLKLDTERIVITWVAGGHNGAHLQFGPNDGYLYVSTGDGGSSFPPDGRNTGQDVSDLLASILRIDVDRTTPATGGEPAKPYAIPADNPFVDRDGARGEVWAYGLRNPWKMAFDRVDGSLWVGDVGWEMWEMIYRIEPGGNYGWSLVEGRQPVHRERERGPTPILPPTVEHPHTESRSITGGDFSTSRRLPGLRGAYVYGDYVTGVVWALRHEGDRVTAVEQLVDTPLQIVSFGRDRRGEVYLLDYGGTIHRLIPNPRADANERFPERLSETGLFASVPEHVPAAGVVPYSVNAEPWADGTVAERFVALPGRSTLGLHDDTNVQIGHIAGEWRFPPNAVLAKTVSIPLDPADPTSRRRLETQLLHYDVDTWRAYNYVWNAEQTDAILAPDESSTTTVEIVDPQSPGGRRRQTWSHASRTQCLVCHTTRAGTVHGFKPEQLDRSHDYDGVRADQLGTLAHIGLFDEPPREHAAWSNPTDTTADLAARARSYLHVNCAHCHRRGGGGSAAFDVRSEVGLDAARLLGERPTQGTFGLLGAEVVAPGDPFRSVLYYRMAKLGRGRMPHLGSGVVDEQGLHLIHDWIANLPSDDGPAESVATLRRRQSESLANVTSPDRTTDVSASIDELLSTPSGSLRLLAAVDRHAIPASRATRVVALATAHPEPTTRDLFERFLPEERRAKRLGTVVETSAILALSGNSERGRRLFREAAGVQCRNCHRAGDVGRAVGPDLTGIGKRLDRAKLLESIVEPSKRIDPKFVTYLVETKRGRVHTGLLVSRDDDGIVLRDAAGKTTTIPASDVEFVTPQQISLMPELLLKDMTPEQVADLLAWMSELK